MNLALNRFIPKSVVRKPTFFEEPLNIQGFNEHPCPRQTTCKHDHDETVSTAKFFKRARVKRLVDPPVLVASHERRLDGLEFISARMNFFQSKRLHREMYKPRRPFFCSNIGDFDVWCNGVIEDDQFDGVGHIFAVVAVHATCSPTSLSSH